MLNNRLPLKTKAIINISFTFDLTMLEGHDHLKVHAKATTISIDLNPADNQQELDLMLIAHNDIELFSEPSVADISLDQMSGLFNVTHNWTLYNNGPSSLQDALLHLNIPLVYNRTSGTGSYSQCQIILSDSISLEVIYHNHTIAILKKASIAEPPSPFATTDEIIMTSVAQVSSAQTSGLHLGKNESRSERSNPSIFPNDTRINLNLQTKRSLFSNRTLFFNCSGAQVGCYKTQANLESFLADNLPIIIELRYTIDLDAINACLEGEKNVFVIQVLSHLHKRSDSDRSSFNITSNDIDITITKTLISSTPMKFYIYSSLGGLLVMALISYIMYRKGFFERTLRNEMKQRYKKIETNTSYNSYFGYAVSSGQFVKNESVLYVASAPRAEHGLGLVLIFDYVEQKGLNETVLQKRRLFAGHQLGEYFGYALLTEDFNNDGLADLAIAAPMHSRTKDFDNGVVYVYQNKGGLSFELQATLSSSYAFGGRFGTSLGKLGDINRDGYGDMAVGAPHEDNGVVYIFLGSVEGIRKIPSQVIKAPSDIKAIHQPMFGYSISRGVDIDGNGYNDLAIGAPNAEVVCVYRSYPIVKVNATISSTTNRIPIEGSSIEVEICFSREFVRKDGPSFDVQLQYRLQLDLALRLASLQNNATNSSSNIINVGEHESCQKFYISVNDSNATGRLKEIKFPLPVTIEIKYDLTINSSPPEGKHFCEHCAILDPEIRNSVSKQFSIGIYCDNHICNPNLRITSLQWINITSPFIIGSRKTATLEMQIENIGEAAHFSQLKLIVPISLSLTKLKRDCDSKPQNDGETSIVCMLNNRLPLKTKAIINISFTFDLTMLEGHDHLKVHAKATTISIELNPADNQQELDLMLIVHNDIELFSEPSVADISLDQMSGLFNVTHNWTLYNNGPSSLLDALLHLNIPLVYNRTSGTGSYSQCQIILSDSISLEVIYHNHTIAILEKASVAEPPSPFATTDEIIMTSVAHVSSAQTSGLHLGKNESRSERSNPSISPNDTRINSNLQTKRSLSSNRTVFFNCSDAQVGCYKTQANLESFLADNLPIIIELRYTIDLDAINACLEGEKNVFVIQVLSHLHKRSDSDRSSFNITSNDIDITITKTLISSTPMKFYIYSSLGGLLVMALISYIMYRKGFFERTLRNEIKQSYKKIETNTSVEGTVGCLRSSVLDM
ncbi:integrin alpha-PS3-like [Anopheles darlingi]|uniref:integrin alpha-PS3-like n=1 Tax=Anopheles darlingi TaxID=43151 RepID=UPI0021001C4F|nr:integrin alpha-PS3-like [Anopheles darlingi]